LTKEQIVDWKDSESIITSNVRIKAPLEYSSMADAFRKSSTRGFEALYKVMVPILVKIV
jgi:hypothetical protein